jgi:hypothetical protein
MPKSTRTVEVTSNGVLTQVKLLVDKNAQNEEALGRALVVAGELVDSTNPLPVSIGNFPINQPVSLTTLPPLAAGENAIGSVTVSNFPATQPVSATVLPLPSGAATEITLGNLLSKLPSTLVGGRLSVDGSGVTQPVSLAALPSLPSGSNAIGSVTVSNLPSTQSVSGSVSISNFPATQPISASALPLPSGAATAAKQPALGIAGTPSVDVVSIQGIANGTTVSVNQSNNAATTTIGFTTSTTSATFTIANRLALIVVPAIGGTPTLTLQLSLDSGATWVNTSVTLTADATLPKVIEADSLAKVSGAFGLANAFRFNSTASITATLNLRSITQ